MRLWDKSKQHETSLSDSEDEGTGGRKHRQSHKGKDRAGSTESKRQRPSSSGAQAQQPAASTSAPVRITPPTGPPSTTPPGSPRVVAAATTESQPPPPASTDPAAPSQSAPVIPASEPTGTVDASTAPVVAVGNAQLASGGVGSAATHNTQPTEEGVDVQSWVSQVKTSLGQ